MVMVMVNHESVSMTMSMSITMSICSTAVYWDWDFAFLTRKFHSFLASFGDLITKKETKSLIKMIAKFLRLLVAS